MTIYSWTPPKKGLVWCASANGFDVSNLNWGGDETYTEVLFELLTKSPTFLPATGFRLRRGSPLRRRCSSRLSNTRARAVLHDRLSPSQLSSDGRLPFGGLEYPVG